MNAVLSRNAPRIDHRAVLARQHWPYASGDYAVVGNALQLVSEELCESVNLCQDQRVLDVAAGNFNASLAAARRWCDVTATDHASDLRPAQPPAARGRIHGRAFRRRGCRRLALRRPELRCSAVLLRRDVRGRPGTRCLRDDPRVPARRTGGPRQLDPGRVHRPAVQDRGQACAAGERRHRTCDWGTPRSHRRSYLARTAISKCDGKQVAFRSRTPMDWVDKLRTSYLPVLMGSSRRWTPTGNERLRSDLLELVAKFNRATDGTMVVDAAYLEVVITRR